MAPILPGTLLVVAAGGAFGGRLRRSSLSSRSELQGYAFSQFVSEFQRGYAVNSEEYQQRAALFDVARARIIATNAQTAAQGRSWTAGVNPFMDATPDERRALAGGYKPGRRAASGEGGMLAGLQTRATSNASWGAQESFSWNDHGLNTDIRNQGNCGSCWAISAAEAVEAQLQKNGGSGVRVSAQALVDCVPNPQHCGGGGGCDGATGELAYTFMRDTGIPLDSDYGYTAKTGSCPTFESQQAKVRVSGWDQLPAFQAQPVMQALVQEGPVVVAVDANNWFDYDHGVFDGCDKDAILGHAVLLKGYGEDSGKKYWQIQNSWGSNWGEQGFIRIIRHDDEDSWCGVDNKPEEGLGCDGGPKEIKVCGSCGMLTDPLVPQGVRVDGGAGTVGDPMKQMTSMFGGASTS